jgi:hypothetical protein
MNEVLIDAEEGVTLTMFARLGYKNKGDTHWTEMVRSTETRPLHCKPPVQVSTVS